jgi:hypothetical protein
MACHPDRPGSGSDPHLGKCDISNILRVAGEGSPAAWRKMFQKEPPERGRKADTRRSKRMSIFTFREILRTGPASLIWPVCVPYAVI